MSDPSQRLEELYERANELIEMIETKKDEDELGPVLALLDDLEDIADEVEDIVSNMDLRGMVDAVDWTELSDAVEPEEIPSALAEGDSAKADLLRNLLDHTDMHELWKNVDIRETWRNKRELDDEMDDLTDRVNFDSATDDGSADPGSASGMSSGDGEPHDVDPKTAENAIQMEMTESVEEARSKLVAAHERFATVRGEAEDKFPNERRQRSRNPTAVSTMPPSQSGIRSGTRYSTVPEETRYSTAPNYTRIYGTRFEDAGGDCSE